MNYSLSYSLGKTMVVTRGDADANAYIAAVEAAGATVTSTQRNAIDDFYVAAKADSYYSSLKRLYFPIWGVAAANAIDMIGLTSGTFNGGVTHGAGFVQGNGSTGYFDLGVTGSALALSVQDAALISLIYDTGLTISSGFIGVRDGTSTLYLKSTGTGVLQGLSSYHGSLFPTGTLSTSVATEYTGIVVGSKTGTDQQIFRRTQSGYASEISGVKTPTGSVSATYNIHALRGNGASGIDYSDSSVGAYGVATNMHTHGSAFTLHLKNLWESCTSLVLP